MTKTNRFKKTLKIIGGIIVFFTLPSLLFFGFVYLKYNEELPQGQQGIEADQMAKKMLSALNAEAYENTDYLAWTFKGIHHYQWYKSQNTCKVSWDQMSVVLDFDAISTSKVYAGEQEYHGKEKQEYIQKAEKYFNNDSFWLVAPYKVFDKGTERRLITDNNGNRSLLVTYTSGGSTPGDSYLWSLDKNGKPKSFKMWVDIMPIGGLEATWEDWKKIETGAILPTNHKFLFFDLEITEISSQKD